MNIQKINSQNNLYNKSTNLQGNVSFNGNIFSQAEIGVEKALEPSIAKILESKTFANLIQKTKNTDLVSHLTAITGVILSGFYIEKTLKNDKLDSDNKRTLAINQGIVCLLSTAGAYLLNSKLNKSVEHFSDTFMKANAYESTETLMKFKGGIKSAASIMIFGTIYRFIGPVFATPIANYFGNKLKEHRHSKKQING